MENKPIEHGRNQVEWCLAGPHRFGDLYLAAIYFFVVKDGEVILEGYRHLCAALSMAKREHGCGYHVVPPREEADRQVDAVNRNILRLPAALETFAATGVDPADPKRRAEVEKLLWLALKAAGITPDDATVLTEYFLLGPRTLRRAFVLCYDWKPAPPAA